MKKSRYLDCQNNSIFFFLARVRFSFEVFPEAAATRSQHFDATCRNIVGRNILRTYCDMSNVVSSHLTIVEREPTTPTRDVAIAWPDMYKTF